MNKEIVIDARKLVNATIESDTRNMNETERKAYNMGVYNAFCAIETIVNVTLKDEQI
ncbi:hypothetical protein [uncultured Robinsoniella sp.]|uniref:hypothetical protein n=1 Tax=uncultured Robinsoniella sp. TaxID=904190 RepID=UPI002913EE5B|nr:hypothetical protein [Clostridiales bacterium]